MKTLLTSSLLYLTAQAWYFVENGPTELPNANI